MENLASIQVSIGKEIEKISNVYRNEKPDRRNIAYLQEKLQAIDKLWNKFEKNDDDIRTLYSEEVGHAYFTTDYYNKVKDGYEKLKREITGLINYAGTNEGTVKKNINIPTPLSKSPIPINVVEANDNQENEQVARLIRRQKAIRLQLENTLCAVSSDNDSEQRDMFSQET